jgi:hypothetical protein
MRLTDLWVPVDFPCQTPVNASGMQVPLGVLDPDGLRCQCCGRLFVQVGSSYFHPDTPALTAAQRRTP